MPPKTIFSSNDDRIIIEIFGQRVVNEWTNAEVTRQFIQRANRTLSYTTLLNRFNSMRPVVEALPERNVQEVVELPLQNEEQPMSLVMESLPLEQACSSMTADLTGDITGDITGEIEENMSILEVNSPIEFTNNQELTPDRALVIQPNREIDGENLADTPQENVGQNVGERRRGRPAGRRRGRSFLTVQTDERLRRTISANETPHQRQQRLQRNLQYQINFLQNETPEEAAARATLDAQRHRENRANETPEEAAARAILDAERHRENRAIETETQAQERRARNAERQRNNRANETQEQHQARLQRQRDYYARVRDAETAEQREHRLGLVHEAQREAQFNVPTHNMWKISNPAIEERDHQGALDQVCEYCGALYWAKEVNSRGVYTKCCERNKIIVPPLIQEHPTLVRLLDPNNHNQEDVELRKEFITRIREINSAFAMATVKCNFDREDLDTVYNDQRRWNARGNRPLPYLYKVHGIMYYRIPPMFNGPIGNQNLRAAQYLMLDTDRAIVESMVENWNSLNGPISPLIIELVHEMLAEANPLVQFFMTNREILQRQNQEDPFSVRLWMTRMVPRNTNVPINARGRRQMAETAVNGEIAAVFNDIDGLPDDGYIAYAQAREQQLPLINIVPQTINNYLRSIDYRDPNCDPLCFPIIFVYGEAGYDPRYMHNNAGETGHIRTTLKEYYKYRLHARTNSANLMFQMAKLFQEYVVCSYIKVEKNNLQFLRQNQAQLRIMDYQGIMDHVGTNLTPENAVGRAFILPSTFEGSDRAMKKHYFDGMELCGRFGKADLFITFTSNPYWPEIEENLNPGQHYLSRPDVCARVYNLKYSEFWNDLNVHHKLGVVEANCRVREYQKRGLPHDHIIIWIDERDKPTTPEQIDDIICAELPDPVQDPELFELVTKYMMHGPCLPNSPCMKLLGDRCSKGFPKPFSETTVIKENSYPQYRRRDDGRQCIVRGRVLDNRYVVPYNPDILRKFCCHVNIEMCAYLSSMKYIFNYICKGNDRVDIQTHGMNNVMPYANEGLNRQDLEQVIRVDQANNEQLANEENNFNTDELNEINRIEREHTARRINTLQPQATAEEEFIHYDDYDVQPNRVVDNNEPDVDNEEPINAAPDVEVGNGNVEPNDEIHGVNNVQVPDEVYDEIRSYEKKRYVSSIEAFSKIFGFSRLSLSHTFVHLIMHLENRQNIVFASARLEQIAERPAPATMLTAFFDLNVRDPAANRFTYKEIVHLYRYNKSTKQWEERENLLLGQNVIARIPFIRSSCGELFFLKLLLLHVRGPRSFEHLRTVNGVVHETFEAAAKALNLVDNHELWHTIMVEITATQMPYQIRFLFVTMLVHNQPINPIALDLWDEFKDAMSEDYANDPADTRYHKALGHIRSLLESFGRTLAQYILPEPDERGLQWRHRAIPANFDDMTPAQHQTIADEMYGSLNAEQKHVVDTVMNDLRDTTTPRSRCHFMDGPGGTGKTYVLNLLYHKLRQLNYTVVPTAFTGIAAALLIGGGQTMHSKFRIPIPTDLDSVSRIQANSAQAEHLRNCNLFIIDEASMVSRAMLECIDRLLRDLMRLPNVPFGGKLMLLTGDFRQVAPVSENQNLEASVLMCIKTSPVWRHFNRMALVENQRADVDEVEFKTWLMEIGNGRSRIYDGDSLIRLPDRVLCTGNLINDVFGPGQLNLDEQNRLNNAILCPTNKDSLEINELILNRLTGENHEYLSTTNILDRATDAVLDTDDYPIEEALRMTPRGFPPHKLNLKVGAIVMLLKNWSLADGLCNGTRFRVTQCNRHTVKCSVLNGPQAGKEFLFCRTEFRSSPTEAGVRMRRFQFPFRLAFAMTINKSQGQTFNKVGILLRRPVFSHGQLYVAASRVRNFDSLRILVDTHELGLYRQGALNGYDGGVYTKNVVWRELLD